MNGQGLADAYARQTPQSGKRAAMPEASPVALSEVVSASFGLARDDTTGVIEQRADDAYGPVVTALGELTGKSASNYMTPSRGGAGLNHTAIWRDIAEQRARDPNALKGVAKDRAAFDADVLAKQIAKRRRNQATMARSSGVTQGVVGFAGGIAGTMTDPVNILTLPFGGGGKTIVQVFAREALLNASVELALQPTVAANRKVYGEELTDAEIVQNVAFAGVGGGVLGSAPRAIGEGYRFLADKVRPLDRKLADALAAAEPSDADVARGFELAVGDDATPDQRAAMAALRRQGEIDAVSPFARNAAGGEANADRLAATIEAMLADQPLPVAPAVPRETSPAAVAVIPRGLATGAPGARTELKRAIGRAESPSDTARNPRSSAMGRYQFIDSTWLAYHRRIVGGAMSDAQRLAQKGDGAVQERLMDGLVEDNARALFRAGEAETAGNLYLAHFAGSGGALKVLKADPDVPAGAVLGAAAVRANPFLAKMTAGDVVAWAHRKMGETPIGGSDRALLRPDDFADDGALRTAQAELDAAELRAALAREPDAASPIDVVDDLTPWRLTDDDAAAAIAADPVGAGVAVGRAPADVAPAAPQIDDALVERIDALERGGRSISPAKIAAALDIGIEEATAGLRAIAVGSDRLRVSAAGKVTRAPRRVANPDLLRTLAEAGGLRDNEGHALTKGRVSGRTGKARSGRDMGRTFVPAVGPLFRAEGMSIDDAGELLWQRGFFVERPSEADVFDMLERAVTGGERIFALGDEASMLSREAASRNADADAELVDRVTMELGGATPDADLLDDVRMLAGGGLDIEDALSTALHYRLMATTDRVHELTGDPIDGFRDTQDFEPGGAGGDGSDVAARRGGSDAGAGGSRRGGDGPDDADGLSPADWQRIFADHELIEAQGRAFDDPAGAAAADQAESLEHDIVNALDRGDAVDPAIADRQRQQAALKAASPLQAKADQDSMIGSPLFDAVDQPEFRLGEEGDAQRPADIFDAIARDEAEIAAVRACMVPKKGGGDGAG